jgi:hypothetical protein
MTPGLPRDVIEDLARRAREAERKTRQQRAIARQNPSAPIRVRVATQPTFTRYIFDFPELVSVSADNSRDRLTLTFDGTYKFDLADAVAALPSTISSIDSELERETATVRFNFASRVDVRTFREENSYVLDVSSPTPRRKQRAVRTSWQRWRLNWRPGRTDRRTRLSYRRASRPSRSRTIQRADNQPAENQRASAPQASGSRPAVAAPATPQPAPPAPVQPPRIR